MNQSLAVKVGKCRSEAVSPGEHYVPPFIFLQLLESFWWFIEKYLQ